MTPDYTAGADAPEAVAHLVSLLRDFDAATLITRARAGGLQGRPTWIARVEDNATLWLVTSAATIEAGELLEDARAMLTLQAPSQFVSINGRAELVPSGEPHIAALSKAAHRARAADLGEPHDSLLRFVAFDAEYWDHASEHSSRHVFRTAGEVAAHAKLRLWAPDSRRA